MTVKLAELDVPPPGVAFTTVTLAVPAEAISLAGIATVSCVALTNVVARALPFHCTVEPLTNPLPLTVSVKAAPPAVAEFGLSVVMAGVGLLMVKVRELALPPPGAGLFTVTLAVPAAAMSLAGIAAVNCVALTKVVVRRFPFHQTVDALTNPLPLTVSVNAAPPAVVELGFKLVSVGKGLLMVKVAAVEVPPPGVGLLTVTLAVPAVAMSEAGIAAVNCVALTKVVVRALPFHCTVEPLMKFVPLTVNVNAAPPAVAEVGLMFVSVGTGFGA